MKTYSIATFAVATAFLVTGCFDSGVPYNPGGDPPNEVTATGPLSLEETDISGTVQSGSLTLALVLRNAGQGTVRGAATLDVEALDGSWTGSGRADVALKPGADTVTIDIGAAPDLAAPGDQALYRIRYRVETNVGTLKGLRSLFVALTRDQVVVMGPKTYFEGESTRLKVFARDPVSGKALANRPVTLTALVGETQRQVTATTDAAGAASVDLMMDVAGSMTLTARMDGAAGTPVEAVQHCEVSRARRVLVTTDKPIYQPGQTMHLRVLSLKKPRLSPDADAECVLEVFDGKGNKVHKQRLSTGDFGVASTTFRLATEVNEGTYRVRATIGDVVTEKAVTVGKYSLPKFNVAVSLDKAFYVVGATVKGTVNARYFFGKPVAGGAVTVTLYGYDVEFTPFATLNGTTDGEGLYAFQTQLPNYLVGQTLEQGKALVRVTAEVADTAGQKVTKELALTVAQNPLELVLIPESGTVVPGVENRFHVFVEDPAGAPIAADVRVTGPGGDIDLATDADGLGTFELTPGDGTLSLAVQATDNKGNAVQANFQFEPGASGEALLVRTDRAVYEVGDTATVTILAPDRKDRIYLDVLRRGQVVREEAMDLVDGQAVAQIDLDDQMTGDLVFSAYYLTANGRIIRDEKLAYVDGADALKIEVTPDKGLYAPGQPAKVDFQVTRKDGSPAVAALGVQIVDEAVFALTDATPGLLKTYFELEDAIREPKYEIHGAGFDVAGICTDAPADEAGKARREKEAQAAFAALGNVDLSEAATSWGQALAAARTALSPFYGKERERVLKDVQGRFEDGSVTYDSLPEFMRQAAYYDLFGNPYTFTTTSGWEWKMASRGPDEIAGTDDDWSTTIQDWELYYWRAEDGTGGPPNGGAVDAGASMDPGPVPEEPAEGEGGPRVRSYFPETLYVNPAVITGADGKARIEFDMADSITEWRLSSLANSTDGLLGSTTKGMTVFMDFFVDLDMPRTMTRGDEVSFPIAVYNYLTEPQTVNLQIEAGDWAELTSGTTLAVELAPGQVKGVNVGLKAGAVGWHGVTVKAFGSAGAQDAVMRLVEVLPDGLEVRDSVSGKLAGTVQQQVAFPMEAIAGTPNVLVKVYPGVMAQAVEGLDSLLQMPSGCFEQTTATLWPNALVLDYMATAGQITPEIELKAREFTSLGYQRLLTYECTGGGFTWFGDPNPANVILTGMGVMEFADIGAVMEIDETLIPRTAAFLRTKQAANGSWHEDQGSEFATIRYDDLITTCFIAWALTGAGEAAGNAFDYIQGNLDAQDSTYAVAMCANALATGAPTGSFTRQMLDELVSRAKEDGDFVYWEAGSSEGGGGAAEMDYYYGGGDGTNLEATALAVLALLESGRSPDLVSKALAYMTSKKDSFGNWGSTHATILTLKAFVKSLTALTQQASGTVTVGINGYAAEPLVVDADNQDVFFQFELGEHVDPVGANDVTVAFTGEGTLMYQVVWSYWVPGEAGTPTGPLEITIDYDKTTLAVDDLVGVTARVTNVSDAVAPMVIVDLGLPPGFGLVADDLAQAVADQKIQKFETTDRQIIVYVDAIAAGATLELTYQLQAKYPLKVACPDASTELYYDGSSKASASCAPLTVE